MLSGEPDKLFGSLLKNGFYKGIREPLQELSGINMFIFNWLVEKNVFNYTAVMKR